MQSKILITGGAGFIGSNLCDYLVNSQNYKVICLDNFDDYYDKNIKINNIKNLINSNNFEFHKMDIFESDKLELLFKNHDISTVIHLAARPGVRASIDNPIKVLNNNIIGTVKLLEVVKNKNLKKFIFASSSSVYGNNMKPPFKETDAIISQVSQYASSKISGESICSVYSSLYSIPIICLRFFTVYGPRQRPDMAFYKFFKSAFENKEIEIYGDGNTYRDYTYIDDILDGIYSAIDLDTKFEIFNLGNSVIHSLTEIINIIDEIFNNQLKIKRLPFQKGDVNYTHSDISKARKILNFNPKTNIRTGLNKFKDWFESNL